MMADALIRSVVVAGGGVAGWMAAATLARVLRRRATVRVIECGGAMEPEAVTLPQLAGLHAILGIDETDLMRKTGATFRLGTEFVDWGAKGGRYFHPLGELGPKLDGVAFRHEWHRLRALGEDAAIGEYSLCAAAARAGKFTKPSTDPRSVLSTLAYAYQLDTARYAEYLRAIALAHGAVMSERQIVGVARAGERVTAVELDGGERIGADLFVDCTGPDALLIGEHTRFEDWSRWLPCDCMVSLASAPDPDLPPYVRATAVDAGWQWRIALQHRTGNGHVYAGGTMSDDEAAKLLVARLGGLAAGEPQFARFAGGRRDRFWVGNVVAIGSAAAVLEPLDGANLRLAQTGIARLLTLFPDQSLSDSERGEYNRLMINESERLRDFLILHYRATARGDTPFWRACRDMAVPEPLARKLALFRSRGHVALDDEETFGEHDWAAVLLGQGVIPERHDPLVDALDVEHLKAQGRRIRSVIRQGVDSMPAHRQFIAKFCAAEPR